MAFKNMTPCPLGKEKKETTYCKGCRENGVLKNTCAATCPAYKKYVKEGI